MSDDVELTLDHIRGDYEPVHPLHGHRCGQGIGCVPHSLLKIHELLEHRDKLLRLRDQPLDRKEPREVRQSSGSHLLRACELRCRVGLTLAALHRHRRACHHLGVRDELLRFLSEVLREIFDWDLLENFVDVFPSCPRFESHDQTLLVGVQKVLHINRVRVDQEHITDRALKSLTVPVL